MLKKIVSVMSKINEKELENFTQFLLKSKNSRIWIIGNGGSSSTASHFTSDLQNLGFNATCLSDNTPRLTAITNDFSWNEAYYRQLEHMRPNDILITISVHGGSEKWSNNLVLATHFAQGRNAKVLSLIGCNGGEIGKFSDFAIIVPSNETYIIEGIHSVLTHIICQKVKECEK